jgi:DNA-binding CsgD family transcriptional regulator
VSEATPEPLLRDEDVRAIVRLLGEVIALSGDINVCRRRLMEGVCRIVGADSWVWCMADIETGKRLGHSGILHGGFDDEQYASFLQALNHPALGEATRKLASDLAEHKGHITRNLDQMEDPRYPVFQSDAGPFWQKANVGTLMVSLRPIDSGGATGIGIYRCKGRPDFDAKEVRIAHIILTEVPWLYFDKFPEKKNITSLYPRHRTVLNLLCDGWDRKKVAAHLGISLQTMNGYVKEIFRHFNVHSQSGLIAKLGKGDGGDR